MKFIGAHISVSELYEAPRAAADLGANAFALNLTDPSKWRSEPISDEAASRFRAECERLGFTAAQILPHAGFVINLASPDTRKLKLSQMALADEFARAAQLGLSMVNFHPGAHLKQMSDCESLGVVAASLNKVLQASPQSVTAVIENTAGQGSNIGYSLEQLAAIIDSIEDKSRVGVCIDTAHGFAAGYDFATAGGYDAFWRDFDRTVGAGYLRGMHLNDSQRPLGSRIDRHAPIGLGSIGPEAFHRMMLDSRLDGIPLILETPDPGAWKTEIATLRRWAAES